MAAWPREDYHSLQAACCFTYGRIVILVDGSQKADSVAYCARLGAAVSLLQRSARHRKMPIVSITRWLKPALLLDQFRLFCSQDGNNEGVPVGFMTWAYLSPEVDARRRVSNRMPLHSTEWCEGHVLWIIDLVTLRGYAKSIIQCAQETMFSESSEATFAQYHPDGRLRRIVTWRRRTSSGDATKNGAAPPVRTDLSSGQVDLGLRFPDGIRGLICPSKVV
jgi:cytolysin-activating lysine-acyltransferase